MSAVTASLCSTLMFVLFVSAEQKNITAESGQDVTLTCRALNNNIIVLEWSRADLGDEQYVLLYRDGQFVPANQHPSFKNRVDLQDRQMKDGDVSLILNNVTINDAGTYECGVVQRVRGPVTLINTTYLHVDPPGQRGGDTEDGSVGLIVGLSVPAVLLLLVAVFGFFIYRKRKLNPADPHVAEHLQHE
ncbi:selection and upkeep of intraepithelial T-cells protein 8-like isoform X3 [Oreochromis niloticus]|nr:selection and upkeep of intraepithelial T-cells protein 8-like isoform X3 [Oreochromis niloticus]